MDEALDMAVEQARRAIAGEAARPEIACFFHEPTFTASYVVADPATGKRVYTREQFAQKWRFTGVVLSRDTSTDPKNMSLPPNTRLTPAYHFSQYRSDQSHPGPQWRVSRTCRAHRSGPRWLPLFDDRYAFTPEGGATWHGTTTRP